MKSFKRALLGLLAAGIGAAGVIAVASPAQAAQYWVDTFANAPGYSTPGGTQTGTLYAGTSYVYCKVWGPQVGSGGAYNHYWLQTDLDTGSPWQGQYVSAYYLTRWGNDEAKDNAGNVIPDCGGGGGGGGTGYVTSPYQFQVQGTNSTNSAYYCGPAATRLALTAAGKYYSQDTLASMLGTTSAGTDNIGLVRDVLNSIGTGFTYSRRDISGAYTSTDKEALRANIKSTVNHSRVVVANVKGSTTTTTGATYSYPGGHYLTVVGYNSSDNAETVEIEDVATSGAHHYYMDLDNLTYWIATKGYAYTA